MDPLQEYYLCLLLSERFHPYVIASILVSFDKNTFSWFDMYDKLERIATYLPKLPSVYKDRIWSRQKTVKQTRLQDIKNFMNRTTKRRSDFYNHFKVPDDTRPLFNISDTNKDIATRLLAFVDPLCKEHTEEIERIKVELPSTFYVMVDGIKTPITKEQFIKNIKLKQVQDLFP